MGSAALQVWTRSQPSVPGELQRALWDERSLVRTWCMRGTLHLLSRSQHATFMAAFDPLRHHNPNWLRRVEMAAAEVDHLLEALLEALDGRALTRAEIASALAGRLRPAVVERLRSGWGELLSPAAHRGWIVNGPNRGREITFVRTDQWIGPLVRLEPAAAKLEWLRGYLRSYGPATRRDYSYWVGGRRAAFTAAAFAALAPELVEVTVGGRRLWALGADLEELSEPGATGDLPVRLLPAFDPFLLGHQDREHLAVPPQLRPLVYRAAGWISPVILAGGVVAGTWEHRLQPRRLSVVARPFGRLGRAERRGVRAEAERLAGHFGRPLSLSYT